MVVTTSHKGQKGRGLAILVALCLVLFAPQEIFAFELFGIHLWGKKNSEIQSEETIGEPKYYEVTVKAVNARGEAGERLVEAASELVRDADKPASGSAGLLFKARDDYRRILAALYAQGYYGGSISIAINGQEVSDLAVDSELPQHSTIVMTIDEGEAYHFSHTAIHDLPLASRKSENHLDNIQEKGFSVGAVARSKTIFQAEQLAVDAWRYQGYAKARIANRHVVADHTSHEVAAEIDVETGRPAYYGLLDVRNATSKPRMDSNYIAWMAGLKPGQSYNPDDLERARKRLARLEVFRSAAFREAENLQEDGTLPLSLTVQERAPRRFGVGASFATIDGAGFEGYWMHRNLRGHGERLRIDAKISGIGGRQDDSLNPENYSYLLGGSFTRPGTMTPDTDFFASLKVEREVLDNYTASGLYLQSGFYHRFNDQISGHILLNSSIVRNKDDFFGKRNFSTIGLTSGIVYDSRNNKNDAMEGFYAEADFQPFYEAEYGNVIMKTVVEGRAYRKIDERGRFVVAGRVKLGSITGASAAELPSSMLFFAGGGGSVRGYGYRNIGVKTKTGDIIGGRSLVEGGLEMRMQVTESVGLVSFIDAGQVGDSSYPDFSDPIRLGAGVGLRYNTSLGPVRFDVARPLNRQIGDPDLGFYIGIGQAF